MKGLRRQCALGRLLLRRLSVIGSVQQSLWVLIVSRLHRGLRLLRLGLLVLDSWISGRLRKRRLEGIGITVQCQ